MTIKGNHIYTGRELVSIRPGACVYCGMNKPLTKDHMFPRAVLRKLNLQSFVGNIVPACRECNYAKSSSVILPTIDNLHSIYKYVPTANILMYADFISEYEGYIDLRVKHLSLSVMIREGDSVYIRSLSDIINLDDLREVSRLHRNGYYEYLAELYDGAPIGSV